MAAPSARAWTADLAAFAQLAVTATDPSVLTAEFRAVLARRGAMAFACGEVDVRHPARTVMLAAEWPVDWMELYVGEGLVAHDPSVAILGRLSGVLDWKAVRTDAQGDRMRRRALVAAESYGFRDGVFVPLPRGGARWGLATAVTTAGELAPAERDEIAVALVLYYERMRGLCAGRPPVQSFAGLTPRERDSLALVAAGCDDAAVAERLGIARSTAHEHVEKAKRKLDVRTRTEAVAIALSLGLIVL